LRATLAFATVMALVLAVPAWAQHFGQQEHGQQEHPAQAQRGETQRPAQPQHNAPRANQGHLPPPPPKRPPSAKPQPERVNGYVNSMPHVSNNQWYGRAKPNDKRYHLDHPFEHGHFEHVGPSYRYDIVRVDPDQHRFWLPDGYWFEVPAWEWPLAANWCWTCGADDFVIYDDPDHPGYYLLYDLYTGRFIHVLYMGS
jgi:hypothetical protein